MQRSDTRERSAEFSLGDEPSANSASTDDSAGRLSGLKRRADGLFSIKTFLVALVASIGGLVVGGAIPLLGAIPLVGLVGRFLGLFVAAFVVGLASSRRRYLEVGLAGALAASLTFVLGTLGSIFLPFAVDLLADYGVGIAGLGAGTGLLVALAGHYFGRDLRDGLTRDVE
ncbi:MAG: hypothetical protein ACQETI_00960 [Halobacteriota archaeon]